MALVNVTDAAAERIAQLLQEDGKQDSHGLRMKVIGGGCSGLQYQLSFEDAAGETDNDFKSGGVRVIIDEKSSLYLVGCQIDFVDTLQESGFKIENPNASNTCGCGQSFSA